MVRGQPFARDEDLAAGVLPEPFGDEWRAGSRNAQASKVSLERIADREHSARRSPYAHSEAMHRMAANVGMAGERCRVDRRGRHRRAKPTIPADEETAFAGRC